MRDRLIELKRQFVESFECKDCTPENEKCGKCLTEKETDYLLENGVIAPPCKVGDKVYIIDEGDEGTEPYILDVTITVIGYDIGGFWITMDLPLGLKMSSHIGESSFGKTVFLTREEAEQALKGGVE